MNHLDKTPLKIVYYALMAVVNELNQERLLKPRTPKNRVWEIDFLRGICIIMMVFDHMMFDLYYLVEALSTNWYSVSETAFSNFFKDMAFQAEQYWYSDFRLIIRLSVVFIFLFLSGISCTFSRSNRDRFFKLAAAASVIGIATYAIDITAGAGVIIIFGILHIMALNVLVFSAVKKAYPHPAAYLLFGLVFFIGGFYLPAGGKTLGFWETLPYLKPLRDLEALWPLIVAGIAFIVYALQKFRIKKLTPQLTKKQNLYADIICSAALAAAGILVLILLPKTAVTGEYTAAISSLLKGTGRFGSDFYGVFPYTGVFLIGAAFGAVVYKKKKSLLPAWDGRWNRAVSFVGRNTIWVYLIHQAVVFAAVVLAAMLAGYTFF